MVKVKVIWSIYADGLERMVNDWLASHRSSDIVNIQFQYANNHVAYITYRDGT